MKKFVCGVAVLALAVTGSTGWAKDRGSSAHQQQSRGTQEIPHCSRNLGAVAIVEPDNQWWR